MASERVCLREGVVLVELLRMVEDVVTPNEVLTMTHELIEVGGRAANVKEQRNAYFGRIFAYMALGETLGRGGPLRARQVARWPAPSPRSSAASARASR